MRIGTLDIGPGACTVRKGKLHQRYHFIFGSKAHWVFTSPIPQPFNPARVNVYRARRGVPVWLWRWSVKHQRLLKLTTKAMP